MAADSEDERGGTNDDEYGVPVKPRRKTQNRQAYEHHDITRKPKQHKRGRAMLW